MKKFFVFNDDSDYHFITCYSLSYLNRSFLQSVILNKQDCLKIFITIKVLLNYVKECFYFDNFTF